MFGDIGHGGVLLAFGIWLIRDPNAKKILGDVYSIRYLVLMMGSFAFYSGWIYNEFFSIPWNVFGSCYGEAGFEEEAEKIDGCVYPIGMDPKWIRASNELSFFNSYKMKFAVIIGVAQMTLGTHVFTQPSSWNVWTVSTGKTTLTCSSNGSLSKCFSSAPLDTCASLSLLSGPFLGNSKEILLVLPPLLPRWSPFLSNWGQLKENPYGIWSFNKIFSTTSFWLQSCASLGCCWSSPLFCGARCQQVRLGYQFILITLDQTTRTMGII